MSKFVRRMSARPRCRVAKRAVTSAIDAATSPSSSPRTRSMTARPREAPSGSSSPGTNSLVMTRAVSGRSRGPTGRASAGSPMAVPAAQRAPVLHGGEQCQRGFRALVDAGRHRAEAVEAATGTGIGHGYPGVVVAQEPADAPADAHRPESVPGHRQRTRARVDQRRRLDRLLVEGRPRFGWPPTARRRERQAPAPGFGTYQPLQQAQAVLHQQVVATVPANDDESLR